eukprot:10701487-Alexandrium_andersonii.AAC.1
MARARQASHACPDCRGVIQALFRMATTLRRMRGHRVGGVAAGQRELGVGAREQGQHLALATMPPRT